MGNNSPVDKLIVQKVFEMSAAGNSHGEIGVFFHHARRWAQHKILKQNVPSKAVPERQKCKQTELCNCAQPGNALFSLPVRLGQHVALRSQKQYAKKF